MGRGASTCARACARFATLQPRGAALALLRAAPRLTARLDSARTIGMYYYVCTTVCNPLPSLLPLTLATAPYSPGALHVRSGAADGEAGDCSRLSARGLAGKGQ